MKETDKRANILISDKYTPERGNRAQVVNNKRRKFSYPKIDLFIQNTDSLNTVNSLS